MSKTQIAILWGLALLVVAVFFVASRVVGRPSPTSEGSTLLTAGAFALPEVPESARRLYPYADQAARSWQGDAALVSASASWAFALVDDLSKPTGWTFQFFSPRTQKLFVVSVDGTRAAVIREALSPYALPTVAASAWQLDSHQALNAWLNQGGGSFLQAHPIVDISARLRQSDSGRPEWIVAGVVRGSQIAQTVRVDASDGKVLP